jgi:hypothetical protein
VTPFVVALDDPGADDAATVDGFLGIVTIGGAT